MATYAAMLRGIMPSNPNMRNEKLRMVFENLGFSNVQSVISSGNILFETSSKSTETLEKRVEKALTEQLGITSAAFIRSYDDLKKVLKKDPFKGKAHAPETYLIVTFLKEKPFEIYNIVNTKEAKTPDFMRTIEKKYGKGNTTRTWKTVQRLIEKMET